MKRYFITGTDTDCGKTYVTARLIDCIPFSAAIKPIASGCIEIDNQLVNHDAKLLQKKNGLHLDVINPWRFSLPVSPHIAARNENVYLTASDVADYCLNVQLDNIKKLFIEGAGGLMVPLNESETWIDFLRISKIPVILVVGMKLGCLNHALLTAAVLRASQIRCVGWIANCIDPGMQFLSENITTLIKKFDFPLLARVPFAGGILT